MNRDQFQEMMQQDYETIKGLNNTKGADYAGTEDALLNFKVAGEALGLDPMKVWGVYASKHWAAIMTFIKEGDVKSEPIEGRLHDVILYCFLLLGLIREQQDLYSQELLDQVTATAQGTGAFRHDDRDEL